MVYLRAPTDELMRRIARRARPYERNMEWGYLHELGQAYDEFFAGYADGPTLTIEAASLDFVSDPGDLRLVVERIHAALGLEYQASLPLASTEGPDGEADSPEPVAPGVVHARRD
jgi:deoxyadenosine/deoxycytidine kinase